jgi:hypothetical protein
MTSFNIIAFSAARFSSTRVLASLLQAELAQVQRLLLSDSWAWVSSPLGVSTLGYLFKLYAYQYIYFLRLLVRLKINFPRM